MTFADLRALHALIGAAIDDIERVYRPQHYQGSPRPSHSSFRPAESCMPVSPPDTTRSSISTSTDSDLEDGVESDMSMPPTPVSPGFNAYGTNNSVRFARTGGLGIRKARERAHTISSLPQPACNTPGVMPPPILKQPPFEWPSLDVPLAPPQSTPAPSESVKTNDDKRPEMTLPVTPETSPSNSPRAPQQVVAESVPSTPITPSSEPAATRPVGPDVDAGGETPRHKEWKKKCEELTTHPDVINAVNRIVSACGHLAAAVQKPFLTLCDAAMGYNLPACLRFLEASHTVEILREAGTSGMHVEEIAKRISSSGVFGGEDGLDSSKLSHILRLLATHHITREVRPDVFANNRISSIIDTGKPWKELISASSGKDAPNKYKGTDGAAAFVGLCTDELFKAAAFLTDCYLYPNNSPPPSPTKSSFFVDTSDNIPPVPPIPPHTTYSISAPMPSTNVQGILTPNQSSGSLISTMSSRLRKKKSELNLSLNISHSTHSNSSGPMTFAQNPHHTNSNSFSSITSHSRQHSRNNSYAKSEALDSPPAPSTPSRPGILKRLSARSITPTPEAPNRSPPPPVPSLPSLPTTPRSPMSSTSSLSLSTYNNFNTSTPKSTPSKGHENTRDLLSTPRSNPPHHIDREPMMKTPKSTPSNDSLRALANTHGALSSSRTPKKTSPPTPKSPLATRQKQLSIHIVPPGSFIQASECELEHQQSQGVLGPAFDLRPSSSPRSKTFPSSIHNGSTHHREYTGCASPIPPPIPRKSSLRNLNAHMNASSSNLVLVNKETDKVAKKVSKNSEMYAPFNIAFNTRLRYFEWLEKSENAFRLKRFGKAMTGTEGWEVPGSVITGFPWQELPRRSVVVDVGGGVGSTSMLLANAFPHLRFVIQDRPPVVEMGIAAWQARHPEMLDTGRAVFQPHDFFKPQPPVPAELDVSSKSPESESTSEEEGPTPHSYLKERLLNDVPAVFLMRVITHDWPDPYVTRILLQLRQAAGPKTRLLIADYVLPLACIDEDDDIEPDDGDDFLKHAKLTKKPLPGTVRTLAPEGSPLLPNLGKANANAYWLDLVMRVMFNAQERTLRELAALTLTAGWKITQVTRAEGSQFAHIIAVPVEIPPETLQLSLLDENGLDSLPSSPNFSKQTPGITRSHSTLDNTFMTRADLPSEDAIRQGVAKGFSKLISRNGSGVYSSKSRRQGGRERSNTFTGQRDASGKDGKGGGEVRKGLRTIMRMLSKPQLRGGGEEH